MKNKWLDEATSRLPTYPPFGMTPQQFADCQESFTRFARTRILGGSEQYDKHGHQRMEELTASEIVKELREEIADAVNYLTGLDVYLARIPWVLADGLADT